MLMKALQVVRPRSFVTVQVPVPQLGSGTLSADRFLIQTHWVSMCGSDIPFFTGRKRFKTYPLSPGAPIHECVGQVAESTADLFQPGDHVVAIPEGDLGLAEFFVAQAAKAARLPPDLASRDTSCMIQPLSTVMNAVDRLGDIGGKSVAIIGLIR
jgi:L-iditol 2-dehydrogenase